MLHFSKDFIKDFQRIPIYYSNMIRKYTEKYINLAKKQLHSIKTLIYKVKVDFFKFMKNIDIIFRSSSDLLDKLIKKFQDLLASISFKYQKILSDIKQKSKETKKKIFKAIKTELEKTLKEILYHLRSMQVFKDMLDFVQETFSWITEKFGANIKQLIKEARKFYHLYFSFLDEHIENLKNQFVKSKIIAEDIIKEILSYPFMKYMMSLSEALVSFTKDNMNFYLKSYNLICKDVC